MALTWSYYIRYSCPSGSGQTTFILWTDDIQHFNLVDGCIWQNCLKHTRSMNICCDITVLIFLLSMVWSFTCLLSVSLSLLLVINTRTQTKSLTAFRQNLCLSSFIIFLPTSYHLSFYQSFLIIYQVKVAMNKHFFSLRMTISENRLYCHLSMFFNTWNKGETTFSVLLLLIFIYLFWFK